MYISFEKNRKNLVLHLFYMSFSIDRDYLVSITSKYETRSFAEDVDALEERGDDLNWMIEALLSDKTKGISSR